MGRLPSRPGDKRRGNSPVILLVSQPPPLGLSAIPIYLPARDLLGSAWLGVAVAGVLLLNPAIGWAGRTGRRGTRHIEHPGP